MMKICSWSFLSACARICHDKICKITFFNRVVPLFFIEKVRSTDVLSGEHMVRAVLAGLDKATI